MQCNPTILEVFKAPIVEATEEGKKLRELFQYVWTAKKAYDAFVGYGLNQRKKFLDKKDNRQNKFAIAYIRTLWNLIELLKLENFYVKIEEGNFKERLKKYKQGNYTIGDIINYAESLTNFAKGVLKYCKHEANIEKINEFLIDIRKRYW